MAITIREVRADELPALFPILLQTEESEAILRWSLAHLVDTVYRMDEDGRIVGAATMQWRNDPCEIMELAIAPERQGQGLGRQLVQWLIQEARQRGKRRLLVGTANSSTLNIAFYQKCGLRMDHVRRDYFRYFHEPVYENGIRIRDMIVFSYDLVGTENV